jgi:hypothetical protein
MQCDGYSLGLRWSVLFPTTILRQGHSRAVPFGTALGVPPYAYLLGSRAANSILSVRGTVNFGLFPYVALNRAALLFVYCMPMLPMLSLVRVRVVAANVRVIMDKHAAYAESHVVMNTSDNRAPTSAFVTRRCLECRRRFLPPKSQSNIRRIILQYSVKSFSPRPLHTTPGVRPCRNLYCSDLCSKRFAATISIHSLMSLHQSPKAAKAAKVSPCPVRPTP